MKHTRMHTHPTHKCVHTGCVLVKQRWQVKVCDCREMKKKRKELKLRMDEQADVAGVPEGCTRDSVKDRSGGGHPKR